MKEQILNYINYLKDYHKLEISVHFRDKYSYAILNADKEAMIEFNCHTNPYCFYVKNTMGLYRTCVRCQRLVLKKCEEKDSFVGVCHAGVKEYVERIKYKDEVIGFICVSGYKAKGYNYENDRDCTLSASEVPCELLQKVIPPLRIMILDYIDKIICENPADDFYAKLISYLENNHNNVTVDKLSKKFNYSKSFISHTFKKRSGKTIPDYCNCLKVRDSKILLSKTDLSITDVALMSGFANLGYFISVFKNETGKTPLEWKKSIK